MLVKDGLFPNQILLVKMLRFLINKSFPKIKGKKQSLFYLHKMIYIHKKRGDT